MSRFAPLNIVAKFHMVFVCGLFPCAGGLSAGVPVEELCARPPYEKSTNGGYFLPVCIPGGMKGMTVLARDPSCMEVDKAGTGTCEIVECDAFDLQDERFAPMYSVLINAQGEVSEQAL